MDCLNDNRFEQLITEPTRFRLRQMPSVLDLIITSDPKICANLSIRNPLGKCDHATLYSSVKNQKIKVVVNDKKNTTLKKWILNGSQI